MQAIYITRHGGPEVLEVREAPDPVPGPTEVRVRVHFAGLNFAEVMARQGLYPDAPKPPCIVGYEGSGIVDQVGSGGDEPEPGMRVLFLTTFQCARPLVCVGAHQAIPMPDSMSFEEGAALPVNYLTATTCCFRSLASAAASVCSSTWGTVVSESRCCSSAAPVTRRRHLRHRVGGKARTLRENGCQHPIDSVLDYAQRFAD